MFLLSISENVLITICALGIAQGFLLASLIYFHTKSDKSVNLFLALYVACISFISSTGILVSLIPWNKTYTLESYPLLLGPLLYLYIRSFRESITWRKALPHLIPFTVYFLTSYFYLAFLTSLAPHAEKLPEQVVQHPVAYIHTGIKTFFFVIYYFMAKQQLNRYQRSIQHLFSDTSRIDLRWARYLIDGYIVLIVATIVIYVFIFTYPEYFYQLVLLNVALATPYVYLATYKGIAQSSIWQSRSVETKEQLAEELVEAEEFEIERTQSEKVRSHKTSMTEDRIVEMAQQVIAAMERDKLYQESELTLQELANRLQFPSHQVSQAINDGLKKNFYDVINSYRVEEAKRLLLDPKNRSFTILSVAFEAGFNSKTTFNTVFKKFTGVTPTEYRDKQNHAPV